MLDLDDTIAAIATAREGSVRGILRLSGPAAMKLLGRLHPASAKVAGTLETCPTVQSFDLLAGDGLGVVPCDVYVWPTARSYTRQPALEIHTIGSPPILDGLLAACCRAGARLARPGEFTLRAFLAGRLDLTQAEAVLGVIDARDQRELQVALTQLAGGLSGPLHVLRNRLLDLLAHLEAGLDFVEEDIEFISAAELDRQLAEIEAAIVGLIDQLKTRADSSGAPRVVLRGAPNAGKSSLFNALIGADSAIVSSLEHTTRDFLTRRVMIHGCAVQLVDTAGISEVDASELLGFAQRQSREQADRASLELFCVDGSRPPTDWEREELARDRQVPCIVVRTKCDLDTEQTNEQPAIATSSRTGFGLDALRHAIAEQVESSATSESAIVSNTAVRCAESLHSAATSLSRARELSRHGSGEELVAAELRVALHELGVIVGAVYTDDLLDRIFSRFCIGK